MEYVLERITPDIKNKIMMDVEIDQVRKKHLLMRGGYFEARSDISWVVDKASDSYMFRAPKIDVRSPHHDYYFYFRGAFYSLAVTSVSIGKVKIENPPVDISLLSELRIAIKNAFEVHRLYGVGADMEPPFAVGFEMESN